jgi:hypothetical protein
MPSGAILKSVFKNAAFSTTADAVFMILRLARIDILILCWFAHSQDLKSQIN